jgi:hypothetical protein
MEIKGRVVGILPEQNGESRNGTWRKQEFILETFDQYPKKVCIVVWGDRIDDMMPQEGQEVQASINIESREYNGRWYTDVKAWKIEKVGGESESGGSDDKPVAAKNPTVIDDSFDDDDLPF